jgi:HPt (histidine-containing phosphotransfer) domain-containing protein
MSEAQDKTAALLASLWLKVRPLVEERLAVLDAVAAGAQQGKMTQELRTEGRSNAHKLAGSLGMYGYDEGTRVARELEQLLESGSSDAERISALVLELRRAVFPNQ